MSNDQREMIFPGLAGAGELAGQSVIAVPGLDTAPVPRVGDRVKWTALSNPAFIMEGTVAWVRPDGREIIGDTGDFILGCQYVEVERIVP